MGGATPEYMEARKEGLRQLGWVEGQNILVEQIRVGDRSSARLQEIARDLVRLKIEVIMASNNLMIAAAKAATTTIPIVMVHADDPVREGYVASLAREPRPCGPLSEHGHLRPERCRSTPGATRAQGNHAMGA